MFLALKVIFACVKIHTSNSMKFWFIYVHSVEHLLAPKAIGTIVMRD